MCSSVAANLRKKKIKSENQEVKLASKRGKKRKLNNKQTKKINSEVIDYSSDDDDSHVLQISNNTSPASNTRSKKRKTIETKLIHETVHSEDHKVTKYFRIKI